MSFLKIDRERLQILAELPNVEPGAVAWTRLEQEFSNAQLVTMFNALAGEAGAVKRFSSAKAGAERIRKLWRTEHPAPERGAGRPRLDRQIRLTDNGERVKRSEQKKIWRSKSQRHALWEWLAEHAPCAESAARAFTPKAPALLAKIEELGLIERTP